MTRRPAYGSTLRNGLLAKCQPRPQPIAQF